MNSLSLSFKQLAKNSAVYGLPTGVSQVIAFLLIPVYTRILIPRDYGIMALIALCTTILGICFGMGFSGYIMRTYLEFKNPDHRKDFIGSLVLFQLGITFLFTVAICVSGKMITSWLFFDGHLQKYLIIAVIGLWISLVSGISTICLQVQNKAITVLTISIIGTVLSALISLILVVCLKLGVIGVFLGTAIGQTALSSVYMIFLIREMHFTIKWTYVSAALLFGLPLIPHLFSHWVMNYIDRVMLQRFTSTIEVGIYSVGYDFGMIMLFIVGTINTAWVPLFYSINNSMNPSEAQRQVSRLSTYWFMACGFCCVTLCVLGPTLLRLMVAPSFYAAASIVPIIAITYFIHGMYFMSVNSIFFRKKTIVLPFVSGLAALLNIGLNWILIPRYSMMGAAYSTLLSFAVLFIIVFIYSKTIYPVSYEYRRLLKLMVVFIVCGGALFPIHMGKDLITLLVKGSILVIFVTIITYWAVLSSMERNTLRRILSVRLRTTGA